MSLRGAALDSALATGAKLITGLITIKLLALFLGAEGLGRIGNAFSAVALVNALASCGIALGVTRYVGQYLSTPSLLKRILGTANSLSIFASMVLSLLGWGFADVISVWLFRDESFALAIRVACCLIIPVGYSSLSVAIINGLSATRLLVSFQVSGAIVGSAGLFLLVAIWAEEGAIIGLLWIIASPMVAMPFLISKYSYGNILFIKPAFNIADAKLLLRYAGAMLITVATHNYVQVIFREWIASDHGLVAVGYWQGMLRISDAYLQVFNVFLIAYLLPKLSQEHDKKKVFELIGEVYKFLFPIILFTFFLVYLLRNLIVNVLLSHDFKAVSDLFLLQLSADFFRVLSYIPGYIVLARGYMPLLLLADPLQAFILLVLGPMLVPTYGAEGACLTYLLGYLIYFVFSVLGLIVYRKT